MAKVLAVVSSGYKEPFCLSKCRTVTSIKSHVNEQGTPLFVNEGDSPSIKLGV
jgi:hypothetical protein